MENFNWFPGHMNKALKNITAKLPAIDLVLEIVDARAPQASSNQSLHKILGQKPVLKLLSKIDWADPKITEEWLNWYRQNEIAVSSLEYKNPHFTQNLIKTINQVLKPKLSAWKKKGLINPQINVLVVGIPNVGKSTFINQLLKRHKAIVSNRPGVTRGLQIIQLNNSINVIDSPGVLPPKFDNWQTATKLVAINSVKRDVYPIRDVGVYLINEMYQKYPHYWERKYGSSINSKSVKSGEDLFKIIAQKQKLLITPNFDWEKKIIQPFIEDFANGKFHFSLEKPDENS